MVSTLKSRATELFWGIFLMSFHRKENALFNQLIDRSVKQITGSDKLKYHVAARLNVNFAYHP